MGFKRFMASAGFVFRRHPGTSATLGGTLTAAGAVLVAVGAYQSSPDFMGGSIGRPLGSNIWFNIGIGLGLAGILVSLFVVIALIIGRSKDEQTRRVLAELMNEGRSFFLILQKQTPPAPDKEVNEWIGKVQRELVKLDPSGSYLARFHSASGLPLMASSLGDPYATLETRIKVRLARLYEFLAELRG